MQLNPKKAKTGALRLILSAVVLLMVIAAFIPMFQAPVEGGIWAKNFGSLRAGVGGMLQKYAEEHNGNLPYTLHEIREFKLSQSDKFLFCDPRSKLTYDWLYFPPITKEGNSKVILAAEPTHFVLAGKDLRLVLYSDFTAGFIEEGKFRDTIALRSKIVQP